VAASAVPAAVRRNTWLLFLAQAFLTSGLATSSQLGSLIVYRLSGTAAWAGVPSAILSVTVMAIGYPAGRLMDRRGRRPGLLLGFLAGALGAMLVGAAVAASSFSGYLSGAVVLSLGIGVGQLTRAAAADMYPTNRRAGAVGLVVTGGLLGGIGGPTLVALSTHVARAIGGNPLAVPWVFVVVMFGLGAVTLSRLRPDPREIGRHLPEYFPEMSRPSSVSMPHQWGDAPEQQSAKGASVSAILSTQAARAAMIALACAQAAMVILMATFSLMLSMHGHSMETISLVLMAHVLGMYALSAPVGRLADRVGRRSVLIGGALLSSSGGLMFTVGVQSAWVAASAFYLVGLGWCLAYVAGAALLGDLSGPATRARVLGLNDVFTNMAAMLAALASGVLLARGGELTVGVLAAALGSVPLLAILRAGGTMAPIPTAGAVTLPAAVTADGGE
jgi:MFS family permease